MHRLGVKNSFTMEASFGGSTLGSRVGTHLGIKDLERMGRHICDTLLDFYDPDPAKVSLLKFFSDLDQILIRSNTAATKFRKN